MRPALLLVAACAGSSPPPSPSGPPASLEARRTTADDVVVATVDGRPVWASCVAAQGRGKTRDVGLRECIDFELMAQAAERRQLTTDRDVVAVTRTALVSQLVARDYEDAFTKPGDFGQLWTELLANARPRVDHGEVRGSHYVRVPTDHKSPARDAVAHALADEIAAALAPETGLVAAMVDDLANRVPGATGLETGNSPETTREGFDKDYGAALFAIPEVGRASPTTRTKWGWDVIVWTDVIAERHPSEAELVAELLPDVKRSYFIAWVGALAKQLGVHVELFKDNVAKLEALP